VVIFGRNRVTNYQFIWSYKYKGKSIVLI